MGILQARRRGTPVILIDPNYLDSLALRKIVGDDYIVHSIEKAVNKLRHDIGPQLTTQVEVLKKSGNRAIRLGQTSQLPQQALR